MKSRIALRIAALCAAALPLASCIGVREVTTSMIEGRVTFTSVEPKRPCLEGFAVFSGERRIWVIERTDKSLCPGRSDFPIVYGVAPHGFSTTVRAERLTPGFYHVGGADHLMHDFYGGGFEVSADGGSGQSYTSSSDKVQGTMSRGGRGLQPT